MDVTEFQFQDRFEAGRFLADRLFAYAGERATSVLALPRGGVPVAFEIARALVCPLDVFVVRKVGVPGYEELAMGAIATGDARVLNDDVIARLAIPMAVVEAAAAEAKRELLRRERSYRRGLPPVEIGGRTAILVDDGLATGATMRAAVLALRQSRPARVVVAVPVAAPETCAQFRTEVDDLVCGLTPDPFGAVGRWYASFRQITDGEVTALLDRAEEERRARCAAESREVVHSDTKSDGWDRTGGHGEGGQP